MFWNAVPDKISSREPAFPLLREEMSRSGVNLLTLARGRSPREMELAAKRLRQDELPG